jgi:hypothetical protein
MSTPLVEMNFAPPSRWPRMLATLVLVAGAGGVIASGYVAWQVRQQVAGLELQVADGSRARVPAAVTAPGAEAALAASNALAVPWSGLLIELESVARDSNGDVAVLAVEPDLARHTVSLQVEARSIRAAFGYVQQLEALPAIRRAYVQSHEVQVNEKEHPVRVELSAEWSAG